MFWCDLDGTHSLNYLLTLHDHLVAGHQDLLPVAGLGVLQDGGSRLGRGVGHGERLQALHSICAVVGQLNGPALSDGNYREKSQLTSMLIMQR